MSSWCQSWKKGSKAKNPDYHLHSPVINHPLSARKFNGIEVNLTSHRVILYPFNRAAAAAERDNDIQTLEQEILEAENNEEK